MRFSRNLKSSTQSIPSPDGAYIATILSSKLNIRETRSFETLRVITLPPELLSSISWFLWSASSTRILLASTDNIRVYCITNPQFSANVTSPTSGTAKVTYITFGATDDEICVFSDFGLKLSIMNLTTSKSVDINSPKFYHPGNAGKGFSYRPGTKNLALLTRSGGKDIISIHTLENLEVMRSWHPESIDAQGIIWSPDGRWLAVWESASQGHRIFVYTADGHLYKTWKGPNPNCHEEANIELGAGIKMLDWNRTGTHIAVGDYSARVTLLATPTFNESMNIIHTTSVTPAESLQVWQEQIVSSQHGGAEREFVAATQAICPPTSGITPASNNEIKTGTNLLTFDHSGTLLATRTESMPTTIWIWDIGTRILRAVMILHSPIAKVTWHTAIDELLMIRCEGEKTRGLVHLWDPSWEKPKVVDFASEIPGGKVIGKTIVRWLNVDSEHAAMLFSDTQDCMLASVSETDDGDVPWQDAGTRGFDIYGQREESPLNLVRADEKRRRGKTIESLMEEEEITSMSGGSDEVDDTFQFRKFVGPESSPWT
ncbi:WD repeat-containing protein [Lachnellula occidentalis]|uniref:WD repeat-containing protein n=1 Tax=Lachnellula occidentalis TaxID=215460 RepID=A0A8H8UIW5_9HELO|nr:WD repeat-containing protein [Lachnellula occidentalis]